MRSSVLSLVAGLWRKMFDPLTHLFGRRKGLVGVRSAPMPGRRVVSWQMSPEPERYRRDWKRSATARKRDFAKERRRRRIARASRKFNRRRAA
jgi:hypothetical protein